MATMSGEAWQLERLESRDARDRLAHELQGRAEGDEGLDLVGDRAAADEALEHRFVPRPLNVAKMGEKRGHAPQGVPPHPGTVDPRAHEVRDEEALGSRPILLSIADGLAQEAVSLRAVLVELRIRVGIV